MKHAKILLCLLFFFTGGLFMTRSGFAGGSKSYSPSSPSASSGSSGVSASGSSAAVPSPAPSSSSGGQFEKTAYQKGKAAAEEGDYENARKYFEKAAERDPDNPDILNDLAHAQRKTGQLDLALENYAKALRLRPHFPEAREYLGEAYIQAALREMENLKLYGEEGEEQLEDLQKAFKEAASNL